jgi:hypothetical protein
MSRLLISLELQLEDDRLGLPFVCLPLWLGGCDPYIPSCLYDYLYAINASC